VFRTGLHNYLFGDNIKSRFIKIIKNKIHRRIDPQDLNRGPQI
jgi:hypothetical protein